MSRQLPRGLPEEYHPIAHDWLNGLVARDLTSRRPPTAAMALRVMGAARVQVYVLMEESDFYARATLAAPSPTEPGGRVVEDSWGNLEPIHDSTVDDCTCLDCTGGFQPHGA